MRTFRIKAINNIPKKERRTNTLKLTKGENYQLCVGRQIRDVVNYFKPKAPYKQNKRKGRR